MTSWIADGNPLAILGTDDTVRLHYIPAAASVLKLSLYYRTIGEAVSSKGFFRIAREKRYG